MQLIRVAAAQSNFVVGDLEGNLERALSAYREVSSAGVDLVVFPELTITGYPPEDLLLKSAFLKRSFECVEEFASKTTSTVAVIGFPESADSLMNSAAVCAGGSIIGIYRKHLLPNYSVFDEQRYFAAAIEDGPLFVVAGIRVGVTICEDAWSETGPILSQAAGGAELIVNLNASPYYAGRVAEREAMLASRAVEAGVPIVYTNLIGGQDELVFDGSSMIVDENGTLIARAAQFSEELLVADLQVPTGADRRDVKRPETTPLAEIVVSSESIGAGSTAKPHIHPLLSPTHEVFEALVLGTRDYVRKNGFSEVVIGLSGGIDSSIVAAIAVEALGADRVHGVLMPSRWSSPGSLTDAAALADALGIKTRTIPIEAAHAAFESLLTDSFADHLPDLTEENLQARVRGTLLMALSNKFGWMVLTTGNKSEMATGYSTLYGDMAGGFAVIKDVAKMLVFELCRDLNTRTGREVIPSNVIAKPPSAELRPDQKDEDSLPPYAILDRVIEAYVERDLSLGEIEAEGFDRAVIEQVIRLVDRSEYKRRQSPPGVRVTPKAFGKDRRLPITNRWYG
ncbi:MAG: NAD+ synthase [Actinobacteria bacterium]|uniref:NAD(+) synthase (glutamine-hydrolyzing) n=1 Tax=freshwater metagenome TaxID=449393 RepID=A0A6J7QY14_9ZZZZ|nr:NAD+ synthase [Actinomycetota bacterium]